MLDFNKKPFAHMDDPAYKGLRCSGISDYAAARKKLGRELTDAEEWAIYDNCEDDKLVEMGR